MRLLQASASLGLDLESKLDLGPLAAPRPGAPSGAGIVSAEVTRYCVLRRYRHTGVTVALFSALHTESVRRGITHWVAGANMMTDCAEDAALAHRVAQAKSLMSEHFRAEPLLHLTPATPRRRPFYTEEQRLRALQGDLAGLELPRPLALFAHRMSARFIGPPVFDPAFGVFALPLVAVLADISARPSTSLTLRSISSNEATRRLRISTFVC